eukprot:TRINITY_DN17170_c0_g1_i1.p1 TRINITY_DN17170_c0_g1~~TRINITY_DN17170_c0_g1_i1.p1  ORF type:complete len:443 (+),score=16.37 TRINITY_DN17170_c0_g1_i1:27-1355(+)
MISQMEAALESVNWSGVQTYWPLAFLPVITFVTAWLVYKLISFFFFPLHVVDARAAKEEAFQNNSIPEYLSKAADQRLFKDISGDLPPPYPNGWFRVIHSNELPKAVVKGIEWNGMHVVAWRKKDGEAVVMEGHCPHMGALLAGGEVASSGSSSSSSGGGGGGDCVECPFHGWQFDCTGTLVRIPYESKVPSHLQKAPLLKVFETREVNGAVFAWHHAEGIPPSYEPLTFFTKAQVDSGKIKFHGRFKNVINTHIQEIAENGADFAHLNHLHAHCVLEALHKVGCRHQWKADFLPQPKPNEHIVKIDVYEYLMWRGRHIPFADQTAHITQDTLGAVHLEFWTPLGPIHVYHTNMVVQPMVLSVHFSVFAGRWVPRFVAKFFLDSIRKQVARDIPVWDLKKFVNTPLVVQHDGPIKHYRRWAQQFYTQSSADVAAARSDQLDW